MTFANTTVTEPLRVLRLKYNLLYKGETVHHAEEQKFTHLLLFSSSAPPGISEAISTNSRETFLAFLRSETKRTWLKSSYLEASHA